MSEVDAQRPLNLVRSIAFWSLALLVSAGLYLWVRDFTSCWRLTSLPGMAPERCAGTRQNSFQTPVVVDYEDVAPATQQPFLAEAAEYPTWDGASRVNILFVGFRGGEPTEADCPFCTDTLILLTVDPITKTAGMISIPRDLWVNIPGFGYSRINTAWSLGRGSKLPGGGPALAMKTISHFIGVPVDYYVQVDFDTFVDIIDLLGGVDIYNDEDLLLDPVAHGKDFPKVKLTCCGDRHLNGRTALAYARCRHAEQGCKNGDFGRAQRQQKVIFAIRDKVLDPRTFPALLAQAPELYNTFSDGIHTNMSLDDALKLAAMARDIPREQIKNAVIDDKLVVFDSVILGGVKASIIRPVPDKIRVLRDQIFTTSGPLSPLAEGDAASLMQADAVKVRVLNGTNSPELDTKTGNYLGHQGLLATEFGTTKAYSRTTIILYSPKLYALKFLIDTFGITSSTQILIKPTPSETVDIEIRLGKDWIATLPAGY